MSPYRALHRRQFVTRPVRLGSRRQEPPLAEILSRPDALRFAIAQDQLRLFYHPIVHLAGGTVLGHEVLIRWQHPELGLLSPADFLPYIEEDAARSTELGSWVLHQACGLATQRADQLYLSVNISSRHLAAPGFVEHLTQILRTTRFSPASLILEITPVTLGHTTETAPTIATVASILDSLTELGIALALDDLSLTRPAPPDMSPFGIVKIARGVVAEIGTSDAAEQFIIDTLERCSAAGLRTVAVGVEAQSQATFLREYGATYAQGYLYGRPKPH
jgi:EAL domain-containing protein (putative c-di-GMP-specific phosphodiesterase class I)